MVPLGGFGAGLVHPGRVGDADEQPFRAQHPRRRLAPRLFVRPAQDLVTSILEAHLSVVSNRLNLVVLQLSSWAAIVLVPTLIAGVYGMNFDHMPELHWRLGYVYALALMGGSALMLWVRFKRSGWL